MEIEEARQQLHHQAQLQYKYREKMTTICGNLEDIRKSGRKFDAHLIRSNTALATLTIENKILIAIHLIRSNTALSKLTSKNRVYTNLCLNAHNYYLHSHSLNHQHSYFSNRLVSK